MVTHERLDGDVIAIHLETGAYYTFDGVAAECWEGLAAGVPTEVIASTLGAQFGVDANSVLQDVTAFVSDLEKEHLVVDEPEDARPSTTTIFELHDTGARTYAAPVLQRYDDLEDLLLLDPIHEVDDAGWPIARTD